MKLSELKKILAEHPEKILRFILPTGTKIPVHAHITEVARIEKRFIDCGGTFRTETICRLQVWFAEDTDHRATARMLLKILDKSASFLETDQMDVDVEYEAPFISQFPISEVLAESDTVVLRLGSKHTACLAEDRCLPPPVNKQPIEFKGIPTLKPTKCC
jgi:hypothetical protein